MLLDIPLAPDQAAHLSFVVALDIKERGEGPLAIADGNLVALFAAILVFASMLLDAFAIEDLIGAPVLLAGYRDIPGRPDHDVAIGFGLAQQCLKYRHC